MAQRLDQVKTPTINVADVVRHKGPVMVPDQMSPRQLVEVATRYMKYHEELIESKIPFEAFPWDGALALVEAMREVYGIAVFEGAAGFFGPGLAKELSVASGPNGATTRIPWGVFPLPNAPRTVGDREGVNALTTGVTKNAEGMVVFELSGVYQREFQPMVDRLVESMRVWLAGHSLYRGKAFEVEFIDHETGKRHAIPVVKFLDVADAKPEHVIFSRHLQGLIDAVIYTPIRYPESCRKVGVSLKRGVLLAGRPGVGKTETLKAVAKVAQDSAWTYMLVAAHELHYALPFSKMLGRCVIAAEDIDTVMGTPVMAAVRNTMDSVRTKGMDIITICTTNHQDRLDDKLKREGRFDVKIMVKPPDAEAVERLVRHYGAGAVSPEDDLAEVGDSLAGENPARIREVVDRAKYWYVSRTKGGTDVRLLPGDLLEAGQSLKNETREFDEIPTASEDIALFETGEGHRVVVRKA